MHEEVVKAIREMTESINRQTEMIERLARTESQQIIRLLEENNRLLGIFVGPVIRLKSEQLAKATPEERKAESKRVLQEAREKYKKGQVAGKK
jgi:hypothetical protein